MWVVMADKGGINAVTSGALLLLMNTGMHIGWATYNINVSESWSLDTPKAIVILAHCSFFIGMTIGVALATGFIDLIGRRKTQYAPVVLFLTSGIILCGFSMYPTLVVAAEMIGGVGGGMIYVIYPVMIGEVCCRSARGEFAYWGSVATLVGSLIFSFFTFYVEYYKMPLFIVGIITIIDSILAMCFIMSVTKESPAFLIQKERDDEAKTMLYNLKMYSSLDRDNLFEDHESDKGSQIDNEFELEPHPKSTT